MAELKDIVDKLVQTLATCRSRAESRLDIMGKMQTYLVQETKTVIVENLDRLATEIRTEAADITWGTVVVLISPETSITVEKTYTDKENDPDLKRLKSQGFYVLTLDEFSLVIERGKAAVAEGNLIPAIKFLMTNARPGTAQLYWMAPAPMASPPLESPPPALPEESPPREPSSPRWTLTDFLPARFPRPPLPRRFFKS
jgi:hypothetical protein